MWLQLVLDDTETGERKNIRGPIINTPRNRRLLSTAIAIHRQRFPESTLIPKVEHV